MIEVKVSKSEFIDSRLPEDQFILSKLKEASVPVKGITTLTYDHASGRLETYSDVKTDTIVFQFYPKEELR